MNKIVGAAALLAALALAGCSTVTTGVSATGGASAAPGAFASQGASYGFARTDAQADDADYAKVEALVRASLAAKGLAEQPLEKAGYRLSVGYVTQPADVAVATANCGGAAKTPCLPVDGPAPFGLPFAGKVYRHVLNLGFVDAKSGALAYRVTASLQDRHPEALEAMPVLVDSALARLPYAAGKGWLVRSKPGKDAAHTMGVVKVEAIGQ